MGMTWTEEQKKVIELRNRNILVSAAAGSGKTAVLVERILSMVTDERRPVDIDKLLIVTFTKAAAGEMKERIRDALDKRLEEDPEDEYLQRQLTLLNNAQITTIDSFCQYVLKSYFHVIDVDPGYRVGEEGELKLLKKDVAQELLEEAYSSQDGEFAHCVECYATGKNDRELEDLILKLHEFSMSYPWPLKWYGECEKAYEIQSLEELDKAEWMKLLVKNVNSLLEDAREQTEEALRLCLQEDGPYMYEEALLSDKKMIEGLLECRSYLEYASAFKNAGKFARLSAKRDVNVSDEAKEQVKNMREQVKKTVSAIMEQYFYDSPDQLLTDMQSSAPAVRELLRLAGEFSKRYAEKKRDKNLVDFGDMEHFALQILVEEKNGEIVQRDAARELAERYEEILIDEYQDSNLVQELILTSVSKKYQGKNNIFMVGDVKQSIYRFRLARPELFMEKYDTYTLEDGPFQRIDLHKNFRSRSQVLDGINYVFYQIMDKALGNVDYNDDAALYAGASFPDAEESGRIELLLLDLTQEQEVVEESGETAREMEARMIGRRILEIVGKEEVLDKKTGKYRKACFRDIVILLRTISGWGDSFAQILMSMGIPAYTGSRTGYFSAVEVQTVLAMLKIIDNPRQDIPMAAVLSSPVGNMSARELAVIKSEFKELSFYEACMSYSKKQDETGSKLAAFFEMLESFREEVPYTPMHELLWDVLEKTGYGRFVSAMPGGDQRSANLNMLVEKAMAFESTSYRGLFNFIRYIENLKKYDVDYGEASSEGEADDTVRIVSIHKSKGLEYPVVFAAGMGKKFNQQDTRSKLVLHPDLGAGCDYTDPDHRLRVPTLLKKVIQRQTANENLGEELRVLYVALTRAKEKLILTGAAEKLEDRLKKWSQQGLRREERLSFSALAGASSYLDWVMPAFLRHGRSVRLLEQYGIMAHRDISSEKPLDLRVRAVLPGELVMAEARQQLESVFSKEELLDWNVREVYDAEARDRIAGRLEAVYPYEKNAGIHTKITVSELKKQSQAADAADEISSVRHYEEPQAAPLIPKFMQAQEEVSGAARGTVYHKILENLDFEIEGAEEQIQEMIRSGRLTADEAGAVDARRLDRFMGCPLGKRMAAASREGKLFREQQFILGIDAHQANPEWDSEEQILVQGIIDAFFYEEEKIVLVDYKTDYVPYGGEQDLCEKYRVQLDYYAAALERMTGKKVKEKILYSFWLQKELRNN